jgi:hypothetical protein
MARVATSTTTDRCELCGARLGSGLGERLGHLRSEHPAYGRGLVLRMAAPLVFAVSVLALGLLGAPQWMAAVAMAACFGVVLFAQTRGRRERSRAGASPGVPVARLLKEGGFRVAVILPVVLLLLFLLGRR